VAADLEEKAWDMTAAYSQGKKVDLNLNRTQHQSIYVPYSFYRILCAHFTHQKMIAGFYGSAV
jgi:hypothetical protein